MEVHIRTIIICIFSCLCGCMVGYLFGNRQYNIQRRTIRGLEQQLTELQLESSRYNQSASEIIASMGNELGNNATTIADIKHQLVFLRDRIKDLQDLYSGSNSSSSGANDMELVSK